MFIYYFQKIKKKINVIFFYFYSQLLPIIDTFALINLSKLNTSENLIIRVDNIGDFILWMPSAEKLCQKYFENDKPYLVCNQTCLDFAEATGLFKKVIGIELSRFSENLFYRLKKLRQISKLGVKTVIQPTYSRNYFTGDALVRASRANIRIGSRGDLSNIQQWQKNISDQWYTLLINASSKQKMELERNAEFLLNLGLKDIKVQIPSLPRFQDLPFEKRIFSDYFVLFPGVSSPVKQWPIECFSTLASKIVNKYGLIPVISGGPEDKLLGERLQNDLGKINLINLTGLTSLPELVEVIRGTRILISNDTSAIHIAAGVNVPSICILGGGHYGRFMPYPRNLEGRKPIPVIKEMNCFGCNWRCRYSKNHAKPYPCVRDIKVEDVMIEVDSILNK